MIQLIVQLLWTHFPFHPPHRPTHCAILAALPLHGAGGHTLCGGEGVGREWGAGAVGASTLTPTPSPHTHPLPGVLGPAIAPITASVARVALRGSDSNHLSRILVAGAVISSQKFGRTGPRESPTLVATPTGRSAERARLTCPHLTALVRRLSSMGPSSSSGSMAAAGEGGPHKHAHMCKEESCHSEAEMSAYL